MGWGRQQCALNTVSSVYARVDGELTEVDFVEGQDVQKGQKLAEIDPRPFQAILDQAKGQLAKDDASLANAKVDLARYQKAGDAVPEQTLATAQSTVDQLAAAIKVDNATIESANVQLGYCTISSPLPTGRDRVWQECGCGEYWCMRRRCEWAGDDHAAAADLGDFYVGAGGLAIGDKGDGGEQAEVPVLAYDSTLTKLLAKGTVLALDNQIDLASGTFRVKSQFPNEDYALFPNQFVNSCGFCVCDTLKNVVLVPVEAIQRSPTATFVYVIGADKKAECNGSVTPGPTEANLTVISKGLEAGEMVATEGLDRLEDGTVVTLQTPGAATQAATRGATSRRSKGASSAPAGSSDGAPASTQPAEGRSDGGGNRGGE